MRQLKVQKGNKHMKKQFETPEIKPIYTKESVVVVHDDAGLPSIMVKVENTAPSKELADPMFIVRGQEYREIYLSQFLNSIFRGRACSLPFVDPKVYISMDDAIAACRAKGPEWHLLTVPEWNYIIRKFNCQGFQCTTKLFHLAL